MLKINEYKKEFIRSLCALYGTDEAESFFYLILENRLKMRRIDLALNHDAVISGGEKAAWDEILSQLKKEIPIQYILGTAHFCGLEFIVSKDTLIPRPETEELVEWIVSESRISNPRILDIGTGSGCIAISLAHKIPGARVAAIDVSEKALQIAAANAAKNNADVSFFNVDILSAEHLPQEYDIIVSNPPYVRKLEKHEIKKNVLDHEPHLALFVDDDDALIFYRKISQLAKKSLARDGKLYFEINQYLGKETVKLLESEGFSNVTLKKDIYGNDRMVSAEV